MQPNSEEEQTFYDAGFFNGMLFSLIIGALLLGVSYLLTGWR